jgi:predicted DNA-binding protein (UPF0251 family)
VPRPHCCRLVAGEPVAAVFKPAGRRACEIEMLRMTLDEFEALRLADLVGLYQEDAATRMRVSRTTFGRIVESAHRKVAEALVQGKALSIQGGPVRCSSSAICRCGKRSHGRCLRSEQEKET